MSVNVECWEGVTVGSIRSGTLGPVRVPTQSGLNVSVVSIGDEKGGRVYVPPINRRGEVYRLFRSSKPVVLTLPTRTIGHLFPVSTMFVRCFMSCRGVVVCWVGGL